MLRSLWKKNLPAILLVIAGGNLHAQRNFSIDGELAKEKKGLIRLTYFDQGHQMADSMLLNDGRFHFEGKIAGPVLATIELNPRYGRISYEEYMSRDALDFYLEPSGITFKSDGGIRKARITGSRNQLSYNRIMVTQARLDSQLNLYEKEYTKYRSENDTTAARKLMLKVAPLLKMKRDADSAFIFQNPESFAAFDIYYKKHGVAVIELPRDEETFNRFSKEIRNSYTGRKMAERIAIAKRLEPGKKPVDFTMSDTAGRSVSLSALKGKNVLLLFWSRNMPGFRSFKNNLENSLRKMGGDSPVVLAVSYGLGKDDWLTLIRMEHLTWLNVIDGNGTDLRKLNEVSQVAKSYDLSPYSLPQVWLINRKGIIVARNFKIDETCSDRARALLGQQTIQKHE